MLRGYSGSQVSCVNRSIIPAVPGNCGAFGGVFTTKNGPTVQGIYWALHREKVKSPLFTRPVGDMVIKYWCITPHSMSITKGAVLRWRKASLGHVTRKDSVKPPQTRKPRQSTIHKYRWIFIASATQTRVVTVYS